MSKDVAKRQPPSDDSPSGVGHVAPAPSRFVSRETVIAAFRGAPPIDSGRFFADLDAIVDQNIEPRD